MVRTRVSMNLGKARVSSGLGLGLTKVMVRLQLG